MLRKFLLFVGVLTATSLNIHADEVGKLQPRMETGLNPPLINLNTTTSLKSLLPQPQSSETPDAVITSTTSTKALDSITVTTPWSLRFDSVYYGASVTDPSNPNAPNDNFADGGEGNRIFVRNIPQLGYYLNSNLLIGAVMKFDFFPSHQVDYAFNDCYIRLQVPKLFSIGDAAVLSDLRVYFPTAAYEQDYGELTAIQTRFVISWAVPQSKFTLGMVLFQQWTAHSSLIDSVDAYAKNAFDSELYAGPNFNYQMTPTLALTVLYELDAVQLADTPFGTYISDTHSGNGYTDFEPGLSWDVTPNINISPFLNMYPGSNLTFDTTSFNVWFSFKLI